MTESSRSVTAQSAREVTLIVVSILIAFALDAWWEEVREDREERAILSSMLDELPELEERIRDWREYSSRRIDLATQWTSLPRDVQADSLAQLMYLTLTWRTPNLDLTSAGAMISSGRAGVLENREIQRWVASWPAWLEDFKEEDRAAPVFIDQAIVPYLAARGIPTTTALARSAEWGKTETPNPWSQWDGEAYRPLISDPGFETLVVNRAWISAQAWTASSNLLRRILELRELLHEELETEAPSEKQTETAHSKRLAPPLAARTPENPPRPSVSG